MNSKHEQVRAVKAKSTVYESKHSRGKSRRSTAFAESKSEARLRGSLHAAKLPGTGLQTDLKPSSEDILEGPQARNSLDP